MRIQRPDLQASNVISVPGGSRSGVLSLAQHRTGLFRPVHRDDWHRTLRHQPAEEQELGDAYDRRRHPGSLDRSRVGLQLRATSEPPGAAELIGIPARSLSLWVWGVGGVANRVGADQRCAATLALLDAGGVQPADKR